MNLILFAINLIDLFIPLLTFHTNVFDVNSSVGPKYRKWMMLVEHDSTMIFTGTSENRKTDKINKMCCAFFFSLSI